MHPVGDVSALAQHITLLHEDRAILERLRAASLATVSRTHVDRRRATAPRLRIAKQLRHTERARSGKPHTLGDK